MEPIIGFVGIGHMGSPMAANLLKAGYIVLIHDLKPASTNELEKRGAQNAPALDALRRADVIITMLPSGKEVRALYEGLLPLLKSGSLLIDCSTTDVATAREMAEAAAEKGCSRLDAPVSGGVAGAEKGTLTFMVGGEPHDLERARAVFGAMGQRIVHCGAHGAGQAAKLCNNLILGASMVAVSEAFVLAAHLQLAPEKLFEVASQSSGQCWALTSYCPSPGLVPSAPSNNHYRPGFSAAMMLKDLKLAASATDQSLPLTERVRELYEEFVHNGGGGTDFSGIIDYINRN